jgi:hypothetical protein
VDASGKAQTIRFTTEDLAILDAVRRDTGLARRSDALRYVLRQYSRCKLLAPSGDRGPQ